MNTETQTTRDVPNAETSDSKPVNRSAHYHRCEHSPREKAFADRWEKENEPNPSVNYGYGLLQDLFTKPGKWGMFWGKAEKVITDDERIVAATVIQWLGSNCGWCFLEEVFRDCGYRITRRESLNSSIPQAPADTMRKLESGCGGAEESKTHLEFSYPNGEYNNEYEVDATADGIELMDGLNLITWEWIERAYATLKKGNLDRQ